MAPVDRNADRDHAEYYHNAARRTPAEALEGYTLGDQGNSIYTFGTQKGVPVPTWRYLLLPLLFHHANYRGDPKLLTFAEVTSGSDLLGVDRATRWAQRLSHQWARRLSGIVDTQVASANVRKSKRDLPSFTPDMLSAFSGM